MVSATPYNSPVRRENPPAVSAAPATSKMLAKLAKAGNDQQLARAAVQLAMLELPGGVVRDEDGVEPRLERRVDVATWAVADHPAVRFHDAVPVDQTFVRRRILLRHDLDGFEEALQARPPDLGGLLGCFPLGEQDQPVAVGEIRQRLRHAVQDVRRSALERGDHVGHLRQSLPLGQVARKLQVGLLERASEAAHAVAVLPDVASLSLVQDVAGVVPGIAERLDQGNEILDRFLEEDVVLPEGVISVDQQGLARHGTTRKSYVSFTNLRLSAAISAAAWGRAMARAAARIRSSRAGSSSSLAIFQAAAGRLLHRTAAPCSSR